MKKCPICDGENNDSAKRCGYCDYDFTSEIDSKKDNTGEMDHSKSDTVIEPSNKSVSIEHDKINACFEKNGHEEDNNDVLKCSMNIVDHNGHNNHIVPILITVIVLLCVGIIVLLLNGHKDNTSLNSEEISNDELFKPVVSEIYNTDVNNATLNNTDKSVETDNSVKYSDSNTVKETEALTNNSETRPDLDVDSSVTASYNSDGTIKIEYTAVPMTMTLPSSWAGKFVVRNGSVLARSAYYGDYGGMLIHLIFKDKNEGVEGISRYLGKAGYKYCFYFRVTDVQYNMENQTETEEYNSLRADIETVLETVKCTPYEDKISVDIVDLSRPYPTGQISSGGKTIEGYTTDYVCHGAEQSVQWICEDTWHITARRRTSSYGVEWYECWDTDDGDYYGWIDSKYLSFYSSGSSSNQSTGTSSVTNLSPYKTGEISSNGLEIEGYTTDYVCNGGAQTRQWICEDTWHITARRMTYSYGIWWYECWDTDDGDYYGWIDSNFLYFY